MGGIQAPVEIKSSLKVWLLLGPTSLNRWPKIIRDIEHIHQYWIFDNNINCLKMHIEHLECCLKNQFFSFLCNNSLSLLLPIHIGITGTPLNPDLVVIEKIIQLKLLFEVISWRDNLSSKIRTCISRLRICPLSSTCASYINNGADCDDKN